MEENTTSSSAPNVSSTQESLVQNPTPPLHKSVYKSKLFIAVVILFIILLLTITASIFANLFMAQNKQATNQPTPTPITQTNPTAGWKTYEGGKFSFKYPNGWTLKTKDSYIYLYPPEADSTSPDSTSISFWTGNKSLRDFPQGNVTTNGIEFVTDWKTVNINGINGLSYQTHQCAPQCNLETVLPLSSQSLVIAINTTAQEEGYMDTYDQILSTFKFADSNSQSEYFSCKDQEFENNPLAGISALEAYCMGQLCIGETQSACINHEVLDLESMGYPEQANQSDCVWQNNTCYPRY